MKTHITRTILVSALPTLGRRISGTVLQVEPRVREAGMKQDRKDTVIVFRWNDRTEFFANGTSTTAAILQPGERVNVTYHTPFFGKPFVSRVKLVMPASVSSHK